MSGTRVFASIGTVTALVLLATHEIAGHSLVTLLLGARLVHVSSVDSSYAGPVTKLTMRLISAAGIVANIVGGIVALVLRSRLSRSAATGRFFLWYYGHLTLFMGTGYLAVFAFLPVGDVHAVTAGLPSVVPLRGALVVAGLLGYGAALLHAARSNESSLAEIVIAYVATGVTAVISGLFNPAGPLDGALWSTAATFGAGYGLIAAAQLGHHKATLASIRDVPHAIAWQVAAAAALIVMLLVLGPGVPR